MKNLNTLQIVALATVAVIAMFAGCKSRKTTWKITGAVMPRINTAGLKA
jgi:hypothetical protein